MDELVDRVSQATGLEPESAHAAIGMVLHFLDRQLTPEQSAALFDPVPGAREAAAGASSEDEDEGGSGLMGLASRLTTTGLGMGEMQALGHAMFAYLREKSGDAAVGAAAAAIPGLQQFI